MTNQTNDYTSMSDEAAFRVFYMNTPGVHHGHKNPLTCRYSTLGKGSANKRRGDIDYLSHDEDEIDLRITNLENKDVELSIGWSQVAAGNADGVLDRAFDEIDRRAAEEAERAFTAEEEERGMRELARRSAAQRVEDADKQAFEAWRQADKSPAPEPVKAAPPAPKVEIEFVLAVIHDALFQVGEAEVKRLAAKGYRYAGTVGGFVIMQRINEGE